MPRIPVWFQARDYFGNKLATMSYADADNGAQQLMDAFNAAGYTIVGLNSAQLNESAEQLYRHFVDYGNAENVSPNNYFNVDYYIQQKIDQLATTTQTPPYPYTTWSKEALDAALEDAGIASYWDHYAQYGTIEGINPSAQFDTNKYLEAKAAQLNGLPDDQKQLLPDGTEGTWTGELVAEALANADLSALEHYYDYGIAEKVDYQPLPEPQPDVYYKAVDLAGLDNPVVGTADNENFIGTVGGANATINQDTQIDGGDGQDMLSVTMNGNFAGFKNADALQNVQTVTITNATKLPHNFQAQNTDGVETWNLNEQNGAVNLYNLPEAGVTVNINGLAGNSTSAITFAQGAVDGASDAMTIGVNGLGSAKIGNTPEKDANIRMNGVEDVTLNATGDNYINLTQMTGVSDLGITGEGNLKIAQAGTSINTVDASKATGKLNLDLSASTDFQSALLGSQDDTLNVSGVNETSTFDGGDGNDTVIMQGLNREYRFNMDNVETMQVAGVARGDTVTLSGSHTSGLETLALSGGLDQAKVVFGEYNAPELTVQTLDNFYGEAVIADMNQVNLNVGKDDTSIEQFVGKLTLNATDTLNVHVGGTIDKGDVFNGTIDAPTATTLNIDMGRNSGGFTATKNSDLADVSQLQVTGFGSVDLSAVPNLGYDSPVVSADATSFEGTFKAAFGTNQNEAVLSVMGSTLKANDIYVDGNYSSVTITGGVGADTVHINLDALATNAVLDIDLGMNNADKVYYTGNLQNFLGLSSAPTTAQIQDFLDSAFNGSVTASNFIKEGTYNSAGELELTSQTPNATIGNGVTAVVPNSGGSGAIDTTGLQFVGSDNGIKIDNVGKQTITLGDTGTEGAALTTSAVVGAVTAPTGKYSTSDFTVINATGEDSNVSIDASADTDGAGIYLNTLAAGATANITLTDPSSTAARDVVAVKPASAIAENTWAAVYVDNFDMAANGGPTLNTDNYKTSSDIIDTAGYNVLINGNNGTQYLDMAGVDYNPDSVIYVRGGTSGFKNHIYGISFKDSEGQSNYAVMASSQAQDGLPAGASGTVVVLTGIELTAANGFVQNDGTWYNANFTTFLSDAGF